MANAYHEWSQPLKTSTHKSADTIKKKRTEDYAIPKHQHHRTLHLLGQGSALDGKDDAVLTPNSDGGRATTDGLHGVLDLEEMPVRTEYGDGAVVAHCSLYAVTV